MKRIICIICAVVSIYAQAKDNYYYYHGERIPISVCNDSIRIYTYDQYELRDGGSNAYSSFIASSEGKTDNTLGNVTSREYIIKGDAGRTLKMSNRFYVQLFDSIEDVPMLRQIANETNTIIHGQVPNISDWYELVVHNSIFDNTLDMSNYFYETGLFKDIDPGFCFNFTPSCLSLDSFNAQWGLSAIHACNAWTISTGALSCKTAIVDEGIYYHDEFVSTLFVNEYDCYTDSPIHTYYSAHGTQVCGVIASNHSWDKIAGVSPNIKIIPISFMPINNDYLSTQLASGFAWARSHGADVINCSWGDQNGLYYANMHSSLLESEIQNALSLGRNGKGCVVVFAAGNQNAAQLDYPAYLYPEILTVGAVSASGNKIQQSSYGTALDVVAPGLGILTTNTNPPYITLLGTSLATPFVSGIVSLMISTNPNLSRQTITDIIESTAQKVGNNSYTTHSGRPNGTWNNSVGYGLVDAYQPVLRAATGVQIVGPDYVCDTTKYYLLHQPSTGFSINWTLSNATSPYWEYSIIGSTNQDTVLIRCTYTTIMAINEQNPMSDMAALRDLTPILTCSVSNGTHSKTYTKTFRMPDGDIPTFSSMASGTWYSGQSRIFSITNCTDVPDSALTWSVKNTTYVPNSILPPVVTTTTYSGRYLAYSTTVPPGGYADVQITATNTQKECEPRSSTQSFLIIRKLILLANLEDNLLQVSLCEENEDVAQQHELAQLDENSDHTLELWHSVYGRMHVSSIQRANAQINVSGFPTGVYTLILKENESIIAQTKVQIY